MKKLLCMMTLMVCCSSGIGVPHSVAVQPGQDWLMEDTVNAADFWYDHGIIFGIEDVGTAEINVMADDVIKVTLGNAIAYWDGDNAIGEIHVDKTLKDYKKGYQTCVVAHEMGHALGMNHVEGHSLMSGEAQDTNEIFCPWSKEDQAEFERVVRQ